MASFTNLCITFHHQNNRYYLNWLKKFHCILLVLLIQNAVSLWAGVLQLPLPMWLVSLDRRPIFHTFCFTLMTLDLYVLPPFPHLYFSFFSPLTFWASTPEPSISFPFISLHLSFQSVAPPLNRFHFFPLDPHNMIFYSGIKGKVFIYDGFEPKTSAKAAWVCVCSLEPHIYWITLLKLGTFLLCVSVCTQNSCKTDTYTYTHHYTLFFCDASLDEDVT